MGQMVTDPLYRVITPRERNELNLLAAYPAQAARECERLREKYAAHIREANATAAQSGKTNFNPAPAGVAAPEPDLPPGTHAARDAKPEVGPDVCPDVLPPKPESIPESLKRLSRWAPWEAVRQSGRQKFDKVPRHPKNTSRGVSTRNHWFSFDDAITGYAIVALVSQGGVGLNLTRLNGLVTLDLDHCVNANGELTPWAREIVERANSYAERSPSGSGVRIFLKGVLAEDWTNHEQGVEVYAGNAPRFVTVTGYRLPGVPPEVQPAPEGFLEWLAKKYRRTAVGAEQSAPAIDTPKLIAAEKLPAINSDEMPGAVRAFWEEGEEGADGSRTLAHATAWLLERFGPEIVLSLLVANPHAMAVALRHRRDDEDRAIEYLWAHHVQKLRRKIQQPVIAEFDNLGAAPESKPASNRFAVVSEKVDRQRLAAAHWIIKGVLPRAALVLIIGASGSGKTFGALDLSAAIARGVQWRGRRTKQCRVVYVCAEGAAGFRTRRMAYCQHHDIDELELGVIPSAPNLLDKADVRLLIEALKAYGPVDVVVIDTFAQVTPGANENSSEDVGRALAHCRTLYEVTDATIVLVHHLGKDETRGARGWSGTHAAADAVLEVSRNGDQRQITVTKMKDGEDGAVYPFRLVPVTVGEDEDGEAIKSCVVEHLAEDEAPKAKREPGGKNERIAWRVINDMAALDGGPIDIGAIIDATVPKMLRDPEKRDRRREYARAAVANLAASGFVMIDDTRVRIAA